MIRLLLALSYASVVIVMLVVYFTASTTGNRPAVKMSVSDCAAWQDERKRDASAAQKPVGTKETTFKDKSLATGVDAAPVLSGG